MSRKQLLLSLLFPVFVIVTQQSAAQFIVQLNLDEEMCAGSQQPVSFGFGNTDNVVIFQSEATMGHSDRIFLPDGVSCGSMGCSYRSPVTFNSFAANSTITSVQDIKYVRLNIEHSWMGDLYIGITCPNNQKAHILKFGGSPTSDCASQISSNARGWQWGDNVMSGTYLGLAYDMESQFNPCDSTAYLNHPGTGWNYCWSNNTTSGYSYAAGDGIIYREGNENSSGTSIDSSNVAAHTNFFHPDQSFASLVGCPLNGEWYIEVLDGWEGDNGYIFEWELALDPSLIPTDSCAIDSFFVEPAAYVSAISDTSFIITAPLDLTTDTTILFTFGIHKNCGEIIDTQAYITFHPNTQTTIFDEVVENNLPRLFNGSSFNEPVNDRVFNLTNHNGCDSTIHYNLTVWYNESSRYDTSVCTPALPLYWHGQTFMHSDSLTLNLTNIHHADSIVILVVNLTVSDTIHQHAAICTGRPYTWIDGNTYYDESQTPVYVISNEGQCDSVYKLHLHLPVNPFVALMTITPNPVGINNNYVTLSDRSNSARRTWYFLDRTDTLRNVQFAFPSSYDSIEVLMVANDAYGCIDTANGTVFADHTAFWAPNAFTPDESTNNLFFIKTNDITSGDVTIYDRQGVVVTSFDLLTGSWDGSSRGHSCPQGAYVWIARYITKTMPNIEQQAKGTITLLR